VGGGTGYPALRMHKSLIYIFFLLYAHVTLTDISFGGET